MIELGSDGLDRPAYLRVVRDGEPVTVPEDVLALVERGRERLRRHLAAGDTVYGVTTGLGRLADVPIGPEDRDALQRSLLLGRGSGLGPPLPPSVTRGAMLVRLTGFLSGHVGVGSELCRFLATLLSAGWQPVVPRGPYGAAGEIGPLAHLFQTVIGEGLVTVGGRTVRAREALSALGLEPFPVAEKEGVALVNGSPLATALGVDVTTRLRTLVDTATTAAALHVAVTRSGAQALSPRIAGLLADPAQAAVATGLSALLEGTDAFAAGPQPAVSTRVVLQVHGAALDALTRLDDVLDRRLRAVTDSPLVLEPDGSGVDGVVPSGGFHAIDVSLGLETLTIAVAHLLNLVERRLHRLHDARSSSLPAQLAARPGVQAGTISVHKAVVGLAAEARALAVPASVQAIDTSSGQEDVQAFTLLAASRAEDALDRLEWALACELVALRQAWWLRGGVPPALAPYVESLAGAVEPVEVDRTLSDDVERVRGLVREGRFTPFPG